jgi:acyl-CoA synthetase (AMP-forming)/AMP-acid ligase II
MAETTFGVTQTAPGTEARRLRVERDELARGLVRPVKDEGEKSRVCVSSGRPIAGCELRIVDSAGKELPPDRVGEIVIRSVSLFKGYRNNHQESEAVLKDGWYFSGDYGFVHEGEYFVVGRKKDIIIVAGTNIYPEDIEDALAYVKDVIPGRAVAFGVEDLASGTEQICVVLETGLNVASEDELGKLRLRVKEAGVSAGFSIARVYVAPPRWLIKSSSGKLARSTNKKRAVADLKYQ